MRIPSNHCPRILGRYTGDYGFQIQYGQRIQEGWSAFVRRQILEMLSNAESLAPSTETNQPSGDGA